MVRAAVAVGYIAVARQDDLRLELCGAGHPRVEVVDPEPQEYAVAVREDRIADRTVMVLHLPAVQLHDQVSARSKLLVLGAAMTALAAEKPLIAATTRLNVTHTNKRLWTHIA
jgi:hypothetical protein